MIPALVDTRPTCGNGRRSAATSGFSLSDEPAVDDPGGNGDHAGSGVGDGGGGSDSEADELVVSSGVRINLVCSTCSSSLLSLLSEAMEKYVTTRAVP